MFWPVLSSLMIQPKYTNNTKHPEISVGEIAQESRVKNCAASDINSRALQSRKYTYAATSSPDENLRDKERADQRTVCLSVGKDRLRIPRNYLSSHTSWTGGKQDFVNIEITYPYLEPFNITTRLCFKKLVSCEVQLLTLMAFPYSGDPELNSLKRIAESSTQDQRTGYTKYDIGPVNSRIELYVKQDDKINLWFTCHPSIEITSSHGICQRMSRFGSDSTISYFFPYSGIAGEERRDALLNNMLHAFVENITN